MAQQNQDVYENAEMDYFNNEQKSDVVFIVEGKKIPANLAFLHFKNRKFRELYPANVKKQDHVTHIIMRNSYNIENTTFVAFKALLKFFHCERLDREVLNDFKLIEEVYELSQRYEVIKLKRKILKHLKRIEQTIENTKPISRLAFYLNDDELTSKVMSFIQKNYQRFIDDNYRQINKQLSDVIFDVRGEKLGALMTPLIVKNDKFRDRFSRSFKQLMDKEVVISDTTLEAFKILIQFLYSDILAILDHNDLKLIQEVCELSKQFNTPSLIEKLNVQFKEFQINFQNLKFVSRIAFTYEIKSLNFNVKTFIDNNFEALFKYDINELIKLNNTSHNRVLEVMTHYYQELNRVKEESAQINNENDQLLIQMTRAIQELSDKDSQITQLNEQLSQTSNQLKQAIFESTQVKEELIQTQINLNEAVDELKPVQNELDETKEQLRQYKWDLIKEKEETAKMKTQLDRTKHQFNEAKSNWHDYVYSLCPDCHVKTVAHKGKFVMIE